LSDSGPLVALERACFRIGDATTEPLTAAGGGRLVALIGYFSPFFSYLRAEATLASGSVSFAGLGANAAFAGGAVTVASRDTPLASWTTERYLTESARFLGKSRRQAERHASTTLTSFTLLAHARQKLRELPPAARRLVSLARAASTDARIVCAEAPFSDLEPGAEELVGAALERILAGRALVVSFPVVPAGGAALSLAERADFVVRVAGGQVVHAGPPSAPLLG